MLKRILSISLCLSALTAALAGCAGTPMPADLPLDPPYLGQTPPGLEPQIFAPGIVSSTDMREYNGVFSPDGREYYFYRFSSSVRPVLLVSRLVDGTWTDPAPVPELEGVDASEPFVTFDDRRLYFLWGDAPGRGPTDAPVYYFVERTADGWTDTPLFAGQGMFLSGDRDGNLYTTDMSSWPTTRKTFIASPVVIDGVFSDYQRVELEVPWGQPAHPCIAPDGSFLIFDVGSGNYLYVSFHQADGSWGAPIDLTEHGFDTRAGGAYVSPDGKYLFFALNGDIWWVDIRVIEALRPEDE